MSRLKELRTLRDEVIQTPHIDEDDLEEGKRINLEKRRRAKTQKAKLEAKINYRRQEKQISRKRKAKRKKPAHQVHQRALGRIGKPKKGHRRVIKTAKVYEDWLDEVDMVFDERWGELFSVEKLESKMKDGFKGGVTIDLDESTSYKKWLQKLKKELSKRGKNIKAYGAKVVHSWYQMGLSPQNAALQITQEDKGGALKSVMELADFFNIDTDRMRQIESKPDNEKADIDEEEFDEEEFDEWENNDVIENDGYNDGSDNENNNEYDNNEYDGENDNNSNDEDVASDEPDDIEDMGEDTEGEDDDKNNNEDIEEEEGDDASN